VAARRRVGGQRAVRERAGRQVRDLVGGAARGEGVERDPGEAEAVERRRR
jgi:hypothetical protein